MILLLNSIISKLSVILCKFLDLIRFYFLLFFILIIKFQTVLAQVVESTQPLVIDEKKSTIRTRFSPPKGYTWMVEEKGSFSEFLVNFPLHPPNFPIRDFKEIPIAKQYNHAAILKIDVGDKDLQQCADAWMRMYAEYLWMNSRFDEIKFEFTSGQLFAWNDYKKGMRTKEAKNRVTFYKTTTIDDSYESFREYLNIIFRYAGTISLDRESVPILQNNKIKPGDFLITPGSPGHSVFIVGVAKNNAGKRLYLLAESFMPAQDVHLLRNTANSSISPWYELDVKSAQTATAKYIFKPTSIKRFHALDKLEKAASKK